MENQPPQDPGRGFLRFRRSALDRLVADREMMLQQAEARARAAEERVRQLEERVAGLAGGGIAPAAEGPPLTGARRGAPARSDEPEGSVTDQIQRIFAGAEETARRIMERARESTEEQLREAEEMWGEIQAEVRRLSAWRQEVEPTVRAARTRLEEVRAAIAEIPARLQEALAPLARSVEAADQDLTRLSELGQPPLLLAPGRLDAALDRSEGAASPPPPPPAPPPPVTPEPPGEGLGSAAADPPDAGESS